MTAAPTFALEHRKHLEQHVPSFSLLPEPRPRGAILSSFLVHLGMLVALPFLLMLLPRPVKTVYEAPQMISLRTHEPITLDRLPRISSSGSSSSGRSSPHASASSAKAAIAKPSAPATSAAPALPDVVVYAGAQEIRSTPPHPTNRVQTILRPDLVKAPKLKFAIRLPSMVVVSSPALPSFTAPSPQEKNAETPKPEVAIVAEKLVEQPALPVPASPPHTAGSEPEPTSKKPEIKPRPVPAPLPHATVGPKTALVINAVTVPDSGVKIPDAEIAGSFVVLPAKPHPETGNGSGGSSDASNESKAPGNGSVDATGKGSAGAGPVAGETGSSADKRTGNAGSGSAKGVSGTGSAPAGPGAGKEGTGTAASGRGAGPTGKGLNPGSGNGSFPGLTIIGGSGGSRSSVPPRTRPGYDLTIVSGGSSGGASHDVGVFGRNETVYTVYISMADAGGGPDWSMQYAVADSAAAGNGLLSPPVPVKKNPVVFNSGTLRQHGQRIFIIGTIDESGNLQGLHSLRTSDDLCTAAINALDGWKFLPAELAGKIVPIKVLIGVFITDNAQLKSR
jgi:hypothetical protein